MDRFARLGRLPAFLVVDDSPTIRMTVGAALKIVHQGAHVAIAEAATEREAVDQFLKGSFDMVFLDMMLAGSKNALDVLRAILAARPDALVVITTGLPREHPDVVEAISLGAFGYLRKPVRVADVRGIVEEVASESGRIGRIR